MSEKKPHETISRDAWKLGPRATVPFPGKQPGVLYAVTDAGIELPVLDLTNSAFASNENPLSRLTSIKSSVFLSILRVLPQSTRAAIGKNSWILSDFLANDSTFLNGEPTLFAKMGPENVTNFLDRLAAGSIQSVSTRFRLRAISDLQADALVTNLRKRETSGAPPRTIRFVNIGGGPALDTINAILKVQRSHPELLKGKKIIISVRDINQSGPNFGARCLTALQAKGSPLYGENIRFDYAPYNWSQPQALNPMLRSSAKDGELLIGASEGALFEYGSDEHIFANLKELYDSTPPDTVLTGSIFLEQGQVDPAVPKMLKISNMGWRLMGTGKLKALALPAGWTLEEVRSDNAVYRVFSLKKGGKQ